LTHTKNPGYESEDDDERDEDGKDGKETQEVTMFNSQL